MLTPSGVGIFLVKKLCFVKKNHFSCKKFLCLNSFLYFCIENMKSMLHLKTLYDGKIQHL